MKNECGQQEHSRTRMFFSSWLQVFSFVARWSVVAQVLLLLVLRFDVILVADDDVACIRAEAIWNMDSDIGLTRSQLHQVCRFVEQTRKKKGRKSYRFKGEDYSCSIEKLKGSQGILIYDFPQMKRIGWGYHKQVAKAIVYGKKPKIVAYCTCDASGKAEINIFRKLRGARGIVPYLGSRSSNKKQHYLYLEYFSSGTLGHLLRERYPLSEQQVMRIAKDLVIGLQAMHNCRFVHRDLHEGNILLRQSNDGLFEAALVDFGKTLHPAHARDTDVPQVPKTRNPPESLLCPYNKVNRYLADVYALGCNFYHLLWGELPPWSHVFNIRVLPTYSPRERQRLYEEIITSYQAALEQRIGHLLRRQCSGNSLSSYERFQVAVFQMIHYDPRKRLPLKDVLQVMHSTSSG